MIIDDVLGAWEWPGSPTVQTATSGLINQTHLVTVNGRVVAVLQRLNTAIFGAQVHFDIEAVTRRLVAERVATPLLIRTHSGSLWTEDNNGGVWRCLTPVGDRTIDKIQAPTEVESAGSLVARFHAALVDLDHEFQHVRVGAQDTEKHLANLRTALSNYRSHRLYDDVAPLAQSVLEHWSRWEGPTDLPRRVIHGDLKISNVRFAGREAHALIDLDTLARGTLDVELGDAMRSWCNPASEDAAEAAFDLDVFEAAMKGYAAAARGVSAAEWASVVPGIERIALNLSARFAADALQESYFGFNPSYGGRGEHNLLRARGQWSLCSKVAEARGKAEAVVATVRT